MTTAEREALIQECIERAEQACRYALKHQQFDSDATAEYRQGWEVAAAVCEKAIGPHVRQHLQAEAKETTA